MTIISKSMLQQDVLKEDGSRHIRYKFFISVTIP